MTSRPQSRVAITCAACLIVGGLASAANAGVTVIDFEFAGNGVTPLANGQAVDGAGFYAGLFTISSSGNNLGSTIFDSTPGGPNDPGPDEDLLVGLGNILILQSNSSPGQTVPGIFDVPNDTASGGTISFDFDLPVTMSSIDLVDIDDNAAVTLVLTDGSGLTRTFEVPDNWTFDVEADGMGGFDTLDFTSLAGQLGEGGETATAFEDAGFDLGNVVGLDVTFTGSGGIDNLVFTPVPAPGAIALAALAGFAGSRRRRQG